MRSAVAGFRNEGNTCYANAALTALLSSPRFLSWLLEEEEKLADGANVVTRSTLAHAYQGWQSSAP